MAIFAFGCSGTSTSVNVNAAVNGNTANSNRAVSNPASTPTNANTASPTSASSTIEQKANAIVGRWEGANAMDDKIAFEFSPSKKEGDAFVGTYQSYLKDETRNLVD